MSNAPLIKPRVKAYLGSKAHMGVCQSWLDLLSQRTADKGIGCHSF